MKKKEPNIYLLIGTYTDEKSNGIYVYTFDTVSGKSEYKSEIEIENPSYLATDDEKKRIYAVSENDDNSASVSAISFNQGNLEQINKQLTNGKSPCYVSIDKKGKHVLTANYSSGSISIFSTNSDGSLNPASDVMSFKGEGVNKERQEKPHLHCVVFSPDQDYLFACDLGTDRIYRFKTNKNSDTFLVKAQPQFINTPAGSGPRHLIFHPNKKYAYVITELSGEVLVYKYHNGNLENIQSVVADTDKVQGSADIQISPDGKFLYASNRLEKDGIVIFIIQKDGKLAKIGYQRTGDHPRNFIISPNGKFLLVANKDHNNIQVFERDPETGKLKDTNRNIQIDKPVCLKFIKD